MRVQIITFQLDGIDHEAYASMCDELAPTFAAVPGLQTKPESTAAVGRFCPVLKQE